MAQVLPKAEEGILAIWGIEYDLTSAMLCVSPDHVKYSCKELSHAGSFSVNEVQVSISELKGNADLIHGEIATYHKLDGQYHLVGHPDDAFINPDICEPQHCSHGELGDYSFTSLSSLQISAQDDSKTTMVWSGSTLDRQCIFGKEPRCSLINGVGELTGSVKNFLETRARITSRYKLNSIKLTTDDKGNLGLDLKTSPLRAVGVFDVFLKVTGLELKRDHIVPELDRFEYIKHGGCRNCELGFWVQMKIGLKRPSEFSLHLSSRSPDVVVESRTVVVTSDAKLYNISMFSPINPGTIDICVDETGYCIKVVIKNLTDPIPMIIHSGDNIYGASNGTRHGDGGFWDNLKSVFDGFFGIFKWSFTSFYGLLFTVGSLILILILFNRPIGKLIIYMFSCGFIVKKRNFSYKSVKTM